MTNMIYDRVFFTLIQDDVEVNIGNVNFSSMKKTWLNSDHRYGFGGLLTRFLCKKGIEEEFMDYMPLVSTKPIDISLTKGSDAYCLTLTMPKRQS